jgi:hypothetical protein
MGRKDPRVALSFFIESVQDKQDAPFAFVQFVSKCCTDGFLTRRVASYQLDLSPAESKVLESVDSEVVAVLLGKRAVLRANDFQGGSSLWSLFGCANSSPFNGHRKKFRAFSARRDLIDRGDRSVGVEEVSGCARFQASLGKSPFQVA